MERHRHLKKDCLRLRVNSDLNTFKDRNLINLGLIEAVGRSCCLATSLQLDVADGYRNCLVAGLTLDEEVGFVCCLKLG